MILCSPENKFILFADDTNVIISDKSSNNLNYKLQSACDDIFLWSNLNKLSINIDKTHCMSFKNNIIFNINIDNTLLFINFYKISWNKSRYLFKLEMSFGLS